MRAYTSKYKGYHWDGNIEIAIRAHGRGRKIRNPRYSTGKPVIAKLEFLKGNTLGIAEGSTKKVDGLKVAGTIYIPSSEGYRNALTYADKIGGVLVK